MFGQFGRSRSVGIAECQHIVVGAGDERAEVAARRNGRRARVGEPFGHGAVEIEYLGDNRVVGHRIADGSLLHLGEVGDFGRQRRDVDDRVVEALLLDLEGEGRRPCGRFDGEGLAQGDVARMAGFTGG